MTKAHAVHSEEDLLPARRRYPRALRYWLIAGLVMIFVQVVVGGITRLTGSGLSITRWEIVTGTLPPMSAGDWDEAFALYRETPQYSKMNDGMAMSEFKFIYFWEYIHRLWARLMGLVFALPLAYFAWRGYVDRPLAKRLALVFVAAALTASFGWIMVASGLINRPLVSAYKLSAHLGIAFTTYAVLLWTTLWTADFRLQQRLPSGLRTLLSVTLVALCLQILFGGMMSGMRAALAYPTWPDLNGAFLPGVLFEPGAWSWEHVINYDAHPVMAALVQVLHRSLGYLVTLLVGLLAYRSYQLQSASWSPWRRGVLLVVALTVLQVVLGIATLVLSKAQIPVLWGVLHQGTALLLLSGMMYLMYLSLGPQLKRA